MNLELKTLRDQISQLKSKAKKPKFPPHIWEKIEELSTKIPLTTICKEIGIDDNNARSRLKKCSKNDQLIENDIPKIIQIPSITPILELSMPSGAVIKVYAQ